MLSRDKTFRLGITMAGAVSAGAYTAGVMDYLLETLELWDKAKARNRQLGPDHADYDASIPMYDLEIEVLSGASAGGITALLTTAAMQAPIPAATPDKRQDDQALKANLLYDTWVNLSADEMMPVMLDNSDIENSGEVYSVLNSQFIDDIGRKALSLRVEQPYRRRYISDNLDIFVTLSNLTGYPYELSFRSGGDRKSNKYRSVIHSDIAHFRVGERYYGDGRIPISFVTGKNMGIVEEAAKATGAFPIGLAARTIAREARYIHDNIYINLLYEKVEAEAPEIETEVTTYDTQLRLDEEHREVKTALLVDGGMLNNEPFEITHDILLRKEADALANRDGLIERGIAAAGARKLPEQLAENNRDYNNFRSTVLMIDPFPSEPVNLKKDYSRTIDSILGKLVRTLRNQVTFKRENVEQAFNNADYSRFLIAPVRRVPHSTENPDDVMRIEGSRAIACGALGGFGGFFGKEFRRHDFFMGRRNCQRFLRSHFSIPVDNRNPIIRYTAEQAERFQLEKAHGLVVPIIPDLRVLNRQAERFETEEPTYPFPDYNRADLYQLKPLVKRRLKAVVMHLSMIKGMSSLMQWVASMILRYKSNDITSSLLNTIEEDFKEHGLIR